MTTLTPEQIERLYDKMVEYWGGAAPNPEYQPKQFQYCVTLFKYYCPDAWEKALAAPVEDVTEEIQNLTVDTETDSTHN